MTNLIDRQVTRTDPGKDLIADFSLAYNNLIADLGGEGVYFVNYDNSDQANTGASTVHDIVTAIGTTNKATVIFAHNESSSQYTQYHFTNDKNLSTYKNIKWVFQHGARLDVSSTKTVTFYHPDLIVAGKRQEIFDLADSTTYIKFDQRGTVYPDWFTANATPGTTDMTTAVQWAVDSHSTYGMRIHFLRTQYKITDTITISNNGYDFVGEFWGRPDEEGSTRLEFAPTVPQDTTGITNGSSGVITGMTDTSDFTAGDYVTISAGFPTNESIKISTVDSGTQITVNTNSTSAESNVTIAKRVTMFEFGSDDDGDWDAGTHDGPQGQRISNMGIKCTLLDTTADNGWSSYGLGTTAIRDWRGGDFIMRDVRIENFEIGWWGIQSDLNSFQDVSIFKCKRGIYAGPRSDQFRLEQIYFIGCDQGFVTGRTRHIRARGLTFVSCGAVSGTDNYPLIINDDNWDVGCLGHIYDQCWFERLNDGNGDTGTMNHFIDIGAANSDDIVEDIVFRDPTFLTTASTYLTDYAFRVGNAKSIRILDASQRFDNFDTGFIEFVGTTNPDVFVRLYSDHADQDDYTNSGSGAPKVTFHQLTAGGHTQFWGSGGRLYLRQNPKAAEKDFFISGETANQFDVIYPDSTSGNTTLLSITRRITFGTAAPASGTWATGDIRFNTTPTESTATDTGWICTNGGEPGTWCPFGDIGAAV